MSIPSSAITIANQSSFARGWADVTEAFKRIGLMRHLARQDIKMRYRRTVLGPLWTVLNAIIFVAILGVVYSFLFQLDLEQYLPFFGIGYFVWMTIIAICLESSTSFITAELMIKSMRVPYMTHILRCVWRNVLTFSHMIPVALLLSLFFGVQFEPVDALKAVLGLGLLVLNGIWVSTLIAIIATRYRDFQQIVGTLLQIVFFITPIFWDPKILDGHKVPSLLLRDLNPFYQQIQVIRAPMIGAEIGWDVYMILFGIGVVGLLISMVALGWAMRRISVWL